MSTLETTTRGETMQGPDLNTLLLGEETETPNLHSAKDLRTLFHDKCLPNMGSKRPKTASGKAAAFAAFKLGVKLGASL